MKICIVGPTYPFKGGISHHTTLLFKHLKKRHEVIFFGFKRQYPRWLYPAKTDKDSSRNTLKEDDVENILDSLNPFSWIHVAKKINNKKPDLVIIPWWNSFWTIQFWTILSLIRKKARILFICHNVYDHEKRFFSKLCAKIVLRKGDYFIVHSNEEHGKINQIIENANIMNTPHPIYDTFNYNLFTKELAQKRINVEGNVILFFGFVRPYKGLKILLEAMPEILNSIKVKLLIVGEFWVDRTEYEKIIIDHYLSKNVLIIDNYVANEEIGLYFTACDLVVLPYTSGTGSGIAQLAFGFNKPIIGSKVGALLEIIKNGRTGYLVEPGKSSELAKAVIRFYKINKSEEFKQNIEIEKRKYSWDHMGNTIEEFVSFEIQISR